MAYELNVETDLVELGLVTEATKGLGIGGDDGEGQQPRNNGMSDE